MLLRKIDIIDGDDDDDDWEDDDDDANSSPPSSSPVAQVPSGTNVPPSNVLHTIPFDAQSARPS